MDGFDRIRTNKQADSLDNMRFFPYLCIMKSMLKSELAERAGVSASTFKRWLNQHQDELERLGVSHRAKLIPPVAIRFICEAYGIEVEE